ncbi:hypothetical protein E0F15_11245 [Frankia sp. B2]|nr:hypothetical protein E0F15_11245 [Frankia sp. B2]
MSTDYSSRCRAHDQNQLPDPACTPGATSPTVTQADIDATICKAGWTAVGVGCRPVVVGQRTRLPAI